MYAPIAVTMGEPAGIGGEISISAWRARNTSDIPSFFVIDDPDRLSALRPGTPITEIDNPEDAHAAFSTSLPVLRHALEVPIEPGRPDPRNTPSVLGAIERAVSLARSGAASGLVTNPIHKGVLYDGGFRHPGHTEFLAALTGVDRTVMMLVGGGLRAVPVTVHIPLRDVPDTLTSDLLFETCRIVARDLRALFGIAEPRLAIAGINPHAGEAGSLGHEEGDVLAPTITALRAEGIAVTGPHPGDTLFHAEAREAYDVAICMYHDQALIPVKTLDFHGGVNVTLGLPVIRTSPDHGTAFNLAGTNLARPDSLISALRLAGDMARAKS